MIANAHTAARGLRVDNPNTPNPAIRVPAAGGLSGDVAQRVVQVLARQVNPSIAAHGGRAVLVAVEHGTAYLRLSGGDQRGLAVVDMAGGAERQGSRRGAHPIAVRVTRAARSRAGRAQRGEGVEPSSRRVRRLPGF